MEHSGQGKCLQCPNKTSSYCPTCTVKRASYDNSKTWRALTAKERAYAKAELTEAFRQEIQYRLDKMNASNQGWGHLVDLRDTIDRLSQADGGKGDTHD